MRYTKFLFIRFFCRCTASAACLALLCTGFAALGGCTDETNSIDGPSVAGGRIPLSLEITVGGFTGQPDASPGTRHTEKDNYDTWFDPGDAIGLFAVKGIGTADATIVDGISNTKLTFFRAESAEEKPTWRPADAATTLYYYKDVTYIAYYPYKENITIDPTQSKDAILASFSEKPELQPAADQSTPEAYAASDLITASGMATDTGDPNRKLLKLSFTHSYSLLVLKTNIVQPKYKAPDGSFRYHPRLGSYVTDAAATNAVINGVKAWKRKDGEFRTIVKPAGTNVLSGSYDREASTVEYSGTAGTATQNRQGGQYYELTVGITASGTSAAAPRALKAGDFYYADGTVWAGGVEPEVEDPPVKENCIGVVFWVGNPGTGDAQGQGDALLVSENSECTHGLVVSLGRIEAPGSWSQISEDVNNWTNVTSGLGINIRVLDKYQGYSNTKALIAYNNNIRTSKPKSLVLPIERILAHRQSTPAPATSSNWYLPSIMELKYMIWGQGQSQPQSGSGQGRTLINKQLEKVGPFYNLGSVGYTTSTEATSGFVKVIASNDYLTEVFKSNSYSTLAILAF